MTRPYSEDIRERALARADAGETVRSIAEALRISPSCVTKWKNLRRETGGVSPGKIGGHKKPVLSGANADWLRKRIRTGPFTLRSPPWTDLTGIRVQPQEALRWKLAN